MNEQRAQQREKLVSDIKAVMSELDELMRDSASDVGDEFVDLKDRLNQKVDAARQKLSDLDLRGKLNEQVDSARQTLSELEARVSDQAKAAAKAGDEYVHTHTWTTIGVAAGIGVVIGLLLNRR